MDTGALLIAHNNEQTDYYQLACLCAKKIKKHLNIPVSLITDTFTVNEEQEIFDQIIEIDSNRDNTRSLFGNVQGFYNDTRCQAYDLTPYYTTLILDVDYIVNSKKLSEYFEIDQSFMMASGLINFGKSQDTMVSSNSIKMKWATTILFKKDNTAKAIFDQVKHIRNNYKFYTDMYGIDSNNFRNDIAFSIAEHIVYGMRSPEVSLPRILFLTDKDPIIDIVDNTVYAKQQKSIFDFNDMDYHVANKQSLLAFKDKILSC